jgi:SAM-dependent methyltransferase
VRAIVKLWLRLAEWSARHMDRAPLWEKRRAWIRELAPGKSFLDLGGMWGIHGEVAFLAEEVGAKRVVLFDGMDPSAEFIAEHARRRSTVRYIQGDLHDEVGVADLGLFDVVWCTGVIYHSPNPYLLLEHLRRLAGERLVLGTQIVPELPFLANACLFLPGLPQAVRDAFASRLPEKAPLLLGLTTDFDYTPGLGYANCWWAMSPTALNSMLEVAAFEVLDRNSDSPYWLDLVAVPTDRPSVIPSSSFSRQRGQDRLAGYPEQSRPGWA